MATRLGAAGSNAWIRRGEKSSASGLRRLHEAWALRAGCCERSAAREKGLKALRLDTNRALTEAHALYRSERYREVARFNDNPCAHHWFEKRL